jgi:uncharacterized short protein YbdD (DUF466 family)
MTSEQLAESIKLAVPTVKRVVQLEDFLREMKNRKSIFDELDILITGPSGSGKNYVAERMFKDAQIPFVDIDTFGRRKLETNEWLVDIPSVRRAVSIIRRTGKPVVGLDDFQNGLALAANTTQVRYVGPIAAAGMSDNDGALFRAAGLVVFVLPDPQSFKNVMAAKARDYVRLLKQGHEGLPPMTEEEALRDEFTMWWSDKSRWSPSKVRDLLRSKVKLIAKHHPTKQITLLLNTSVPKTAAGWHDSKNWFR